MPPVARTTLFVALVYATLGAITPYLPVWYVEEKGLSGAELGIILSAGSFARIVVGPVVGAWVEGRGDHRTPLLTLSVLATLFFWLLPLGDGFAAVFAIALAASIAFQSLTPLSEAAIQRGTEGGSRFTYARARAVASAVFIAANLAGGAILQARGVEAVYAFILASATGAVVAAVALPTEPRPAQARRTYRVRIGEGVAMLRTPGVAGLLLAAACVQAAHAFYYAFSSTLWLAQGVPASQVGVLWATGVAVEIAFLALFAGRLDRFRPETLIAVGALAAIVRWSLMALAPPFALALPLQALHAATFAITLIGSMRLVRERFGADKGPLAQTMISAAIMAPVFGTATLVSGPLHDAFGAGGYLGAAALAATGGALAWRARGRGRGRGRRGVSADAAAAD